MRELRSVQVLVQKSTALGKRDRDRDDPADAAEICAFGCEKVQMDVQHVFHLNEEVRVEDEVVQGGADRAVDRVLDGDEGGIDLAPSAASSASAIVDIATGSAPASNGIDKRASSLKVPSGPKNAIRFQPCTGLYMRAG